MRPKTKQRGPIETCVRRAAEKSLDRWRNKLERQDDMTDRCRVLIRMGRKCGIKIDMAVNDDAEMEIVSIDGTDLEPEPLLLFADDPVGEVWEIVLARWATPHWVQAKLYFGSETQSVPVRVDWKAWAAAHRLLRQRG
jgi:hypothetical protein